MISDQGAAQEFHHQSNPWDNNCSVSRECQCVIFVYTQSMPAIQITPSSQSQSVPTIQIGKHFPLQQGTKMCKIFVLSFFCYVCSFVGPVALHAVFMVSKAFSMGIAAIIQFHILLGHLLVAQVAWAALSKIDPELLWRSAEWKLTMWLQPVVAQCNAKSSLRS